MRACAAARSTKRRPLSCNGRGRAWVVARWLGASRAAVHTMAEGAAGSTFWFNVSYGAGETALFNADCWAVVLLDYMKEHCGYAHLDEPVDLLKEDQSCSLDLRLVGKESATTVLEPKGKYILAKVIAPEAEGGAPTFEALWEAPEGYEPPPPPPPAGKKK